MPKGVYPHPPRIPCFATGCSHLMDVRQTGFCWMHQRRFARNGTPDRVQAIQPNVCIIKGCGKTPKGKGMCSAHYTLWLRYRDPLHKRTIRPDTRAKISKTLKGRRLSDDHARKLIQGRGHKPTDIERELTGLLSDQHLPFRYCGDGQVIIGGKCPDFININGRKQLIEIFGRYWHDLLDPARRVAHFAQYGFNTLIVWDEELKFKDRLIRRLIRFATTRDRSPQRAGVATSHRMPTTSRRAMGRRSSRPRKECDA